MSKETIDIEQLLVWAYQVQCVDRAVASLKPHGPAISLTGVLGQVAELGTRVDHSGLAARMAGIKLPEDAAIIHDAVLALDDMWIEWMGDDEIAIWDRERAGQNGFVIEQRGGMWWLVAVYSASDCMPAPVRIDRASTSVLLILHGKNATRPECHSGWSAPRGRTSADGVESDGRGRQRRRPEGASLEEVMFDRAQYHVWHAAMSLLAIDLDGMLANFVISGPSAPPAPWQGLPKRVLTAA